MGTRGFHRKEAEDEATSASRKKFLPVLMIQLMLPAPAVLALVHIDDDPKKQKS